MVIADQEWLKIRSPLEEAGTISSIKKVAVWLALDCPNPPPSAYKQELVNAYRKHYGLLTLVETGTFLGDMVEYSSAFFKEIYSIELSDDLYQRALARFKNYKTVHLYKGDSGEVLPQILKKIKTPAVFWLDAHYSSGETARGSLDTPIEKELEDILSHKIKQHVVLIDDARLFNGRNDYPTVAKIRKLVSGKGTFNITVRHDVIRILPDDANIDI